MWSSIGQQRFVLALNKALRGVGLVAIAASCLVVSCDRRPGYVERFADFVAHQEENLSTDVVSPVRNASQASFGWIKVSEAGSDEEVLEISGRYGVVLFRAVEAETIGVEIEAALDRDEPTTRRVQVLLNGERCGRIRVTDSWEKLSLSFAPGVVRPGLNTLTLRPYRRRADRETGGGAAVHVRSIRFVPASGRVPRPHRLTRLGVAEASDSDESVVEVPTGSHLDLVTELPSGAKLTAGLEVEPALAEEGVVAVGIELLDEAGGTATLFRQNFEEPAELEIDAALSEWSGQTARLRLVVAGSRNARVRWLNAEVTSSASAQSAVEPTIESVARSGRLGRPDIMLVVLDTARADAFSAGGSDVQTPHFDSLGDSGTLFREARAPAPWTGQTVPALLTGLHPDSLGIEAWGDRLPAGARTLPEEMAKNGYRTVLFSQHPIYRYQRDLTRGFEERYLGRRGDRDHLPTAEQLSSSDRPTFALVHLLPPHDPYQPPAPFLGSLTDWYQGAIEPLADFLSSFPHRRAPETVSHDDLRFIRQRYLENVIYADALLGRLLTSLRSSGKFDEALVVVTSDHGEAFLEHDAFLHTKTLYRELLHIPLAIKWPAGLETATDTTEEPVSLVDLAPTLVDGLALETESDLMQGRSLLPVVFDAAPRGRWIYSTTRGASRRSHRPHRLIAVERDSWKLIWGVESGVGELYNLEEDPGEVDDLVEAEPMRALAMQQLALRQWAYNRSLRKAVGAHQGAIDLDPKMIEELKALGYF